MTGPNTQSSPSSGGSGLAPNVAALLCYVCTLITGIVFLVIEKENKDVRFHAWQAIFFALAAVVIRGVLAVLTVVASSISEGLMVGLALLNMLVGLATLALWIICMVKAYQGGRWKIPFIGDFAEKQVR